MLRDIVSERESLVDHAADAHVQTDHVSAKLQQFSWKEPGEGVFRPDHPFIHLMIGTSSRMQRKYAKGAADDHWAEPGEILFIPGNTDLYCNWTKGGGKVLSCWFEPESICGREGLEWRWPDFDLDATLGLKNPYISMAMRRIVDELRARSFTSDIQVESALTFIMLELRKQLSGTGAASEPAGGALSARQLRIIDEMVLEGDGRATSIADLARACGCAPRTLPILYRRATGRTLRDHVAGARIERAKALLLTEAAMVKQIAYLSGFQTPAAFCAAFRVATGLTPSQFRASNGVVAH